MRGSASALRRMPIPGGQIIQQTLCVRHLEMLDAKQNGEFGFWLCRTFASTKAKQSEWLYVPGLTPSRTQKRPSRVVHRVELILQPRLSPICLKDYV